MVLAERDGVHEGSQEESLGHGAQLETRNAFTEEEIEAELAKCAHPVFGAFYFILNYVFIENPQPEEAGEIAGWLPFLLWPEQMEVLQALLEHKQNIILKARQLGLSWLCLAYALWLMIFKPGSAIGIWSQREEDAIYLLDDRMKGIYNHLPEWMRPDVTIDTKTRWELGNESIARAYPANKGDSYTNTFALVDEAALLQDLGGLLGRVMPTIDNGGKIALISRADKKKPAGSFNRIFQEAQAGGNSWQAIFLPWWVHPERDQAWYERVKRDIVKETGIDDRMKEQYPATPEEAMEPNSLDKRFPAEWINKCYRRAEPIDRSEWRAAPIGLPKQLRVYVHPKPGGRYVIGADPAEGNPTSDYSAFKVLNYDTGEEVASYSLRAEPDTFAHHIHMASQWYNRAPAMVERNNHGHGVISKLRGKVRVLHGHDGRRGWLSSSFGKNKLYDDASEQFRDSQTFIHDSKSFIQLKSIEGGTNRAPDGMHDDDADAYCLALVGRLERNRARQEALPEGIAEYRGG